MTKKTFCTKCGEKLEKRFTFCPVCGTAIKKHKPAATPKDDKITPISPEARRILEDFDAQFEALKFKQGQRSGLANKLRRQSENPNFKFIFISVAVILFTLLVIAMIFLINNLPMLVEHFKDAGQY